MQKIIFIFFWRSIYLKLETVHKFIESRKKWINIMHICNYRMGVDISTIHDCMLKFQSNIHQSNIITLHYTGNKFLQSGLEGNKYSNNKSLNHATINHAVHYAILQNTELIIYHLSGNYSTSPDQYQILSRMYLWYWQVYTGLIWMILFWSRKSLI